MQITDIKVRKLFEEGPMKAIVSVTFDGRIRVKFESYEQIGEKIKFAAQILKAKAVEEKGTLYVPTPEKATFEADR